MPRERRDQCFRLFGSDDCGGERRLGGSQMIVVATLQGQQMAFGRGQSLLDQRHGDRRFAQLFGPFGRPSIEFALVFGPQLSHVRAVLALQIASADSRIGRDDTTVEIGAKLGDLRLRRMPGRNGCLASSRDLNQF